MKIVLIVIGIIILGGIAWFVFSESNDTNTNTTSGNTTTNTPVNRNEASNTNADGLNINVTNDSGSNVNATSNANTGTTNTASSNTNSANTNTTSNQSVIVTASGFSPKTVTIGVGQSVTWMNSDNRPHYVAPDDHPSHQAYSGIWDDNGAGNISSEELYTFQFNTAGTYTYHDYLNSSLTGTVVVR